MGLEHEFFLLDENECTVERIWLSDPRKLKFHAKINIHDDVIMYLHDSWRWISTSLEKGSHNHHGLSYYGTTLIRERGAAQLHQILEAWVSLFSSGPKKLNLTGAFRYDEDKDEGDYHRIRLDRDNLIQLLKELSAMAKKVMKDKNYYILHLGI